MEEKPKVNAKADDIDVPTPKAKEDPLKKKQDKKPEQVKEGLLKRASFREYLDAKSKMIDKPPTETVPDYDGPDPKAPEYSIIPDQLSADGGKPSTKKGPEQKPYRAAGSDPGQKKGESGFADLGAKELVYNPGTGTKTEQFLDATKGMNLKEFTEFMSQECGCNIQSESLPTVTAYAAGKFQPHPPEAIRYVTALANKNERLMESLVHELKREGALGKLVKALMDHPETYGEMTQLLSGSTEGLSRARSLARAMNENYSNFLQEHLSEHVGPPFGGQDMGDDEEDSDDPDATDDNGGDDDDDMGGDMGDDDGSDQDMDGDDDQDMGDDQDDGSDDMGGETGDDQDAMGGGSGKPPFPKKKFAHNNLLGSMASYESFVNAMKHVLKG